MHIHSTCRGSKVGFKDGCDVSIGFDGEGLESLQCGGDEFTCDEFVFKYRCVITGRGERAVVQLGSSPHRRSAFKELLFAMHARGISFSRKFLYAAGVCLCVCCHVHQGSFQARWPHQR